MWGEVHAPQAPPSSRHWKVELGLDELKLKLALVAVVEAGGAAVIVVSGGAVSIVNVRLALWPWLPALSDC